MEITGAVLEEVGRPAPYRESTPITVGSLELDAPGPGELLVRIEASGLCHSDLSVVNGARPRPVPMLLGHESAGTVVQTGDGVDDLEIGQRVVMAFLPRCGKCSGCLTDGRLPCVPGTAANTAGTLLSGGVRLHRDGREILHHLGVSGFATHAVVSRLSVVPVPATVPPSVASVLGCAVLTGAGAVVNAGRPQTGDDVVVVGLGGVGMAAILAALALRTGRVYAVDAVDDKRGQALELGVDAAFGPQEALEAGIRAPVVVEAAGNVRALETAFALTSPGGTTVTAGLPHPDQRAQIPGAQLTAEARTVVGCYLGSSVPSRDIPGYAKMWEDGRLPVETLISSTIGLDDINGAMDRLAAGEVVRQVIVFDR
ncbi:MAG: alcohol dehydrogenase catalytic domain-containing protein [Bifidobacteriaceae bacterium]|jgi:alcohol dehydrogenase|nr:alcohol dehydrogenase catalytic domain-containing protein [Bifidobacteriaceae bacterium]